MNDIFNENVPLKTETPAFAKHVLPAVPLSEVYLEDCVTALKRFNDNHFDLAIVDPPYDFGITGTHYASQKKYGHKQENRPNSGIKIGGNYLDALSDIPNSEYFKQLFRVSKNQIIWGGNYFTQHLSPSMCWIGWYKMNGDKSYFSDFELAWTSYQKRTYIFKEPISKTHKGRIHPTQKPITLYEFCYYVAKLEQGDLILDTHLGSGSSRIAAYKGGFDFVGFEIDSDYFNAQEKRFNEFKSQLRLF